MNRVALFNLFVTLVGVVIVVTLIFYAMQFRPLPEPYNKFARFAVGGAAFLIVVFAVGAVLGMTGGAGGAHVTIGGILEFAISVIILFAVLYFCDWGLDNWSIPYAEQIKMFLTFCALVLILWAAEIALVGGGLGVINIGETHRSSLAPVDQRVGLSPDGGISYLPAK